MSLIEAFIVPHPPLIIPEVGKGEENKVSRTIASYKKIANRIAELKPDTIILSTPHSIMYADYLHISPGSEAEGNFSAFGASRVSLNATYDEEFVEVLEGCAERVGVEAGTLGEKEPSLDHGTMVPLYYINQAYKGYKLVRIGLSGLPAIDHYRLGRCIAETSDKLNRRMVFVASGDLSHKLRKEGPYGYAPEGPEFDRKITEAMASGDFMSFLHFSQEECEAAAECGLKSFIIMSGALSGKAVEPELLSYEGTFGVGYAVCTYRVKGEDGSRHFDKQYEARQKELAKERQKQEDSYVRLARYSLETFIRTGKRLRLSDGLQGETITIENLPKEMLEKKAGVFVSLKKHGELRGCIGTIAPAADSIAKEIMRNAVSAAVEDPRFAPVSIEELDDLIYSVDILAEPEPIKSPEELDVKRYGVIVSSGRRRGMLLPNLEGVDTVEKQLEIARRKAGIYDNEEIKLERFEVVRHK